MEELVAVSFRDRRRATEVFNLLWQMNDSLVIELDDAVIVHRDRYGKLEYGQDFTSTLDRTLVQKGLWGAVLGALVAASFAIGTSAIPNPVILCACVLAGGLLGVIAGTLDAANTEASWKDNNCAPRSLVQEVVDGIEPDNSAVVAWVNSAGLETAASAFRGMGGKVLRTTLPPEEIATLESVLKG